MLVGEILSAATAAQFEVQKPVGNVGVIITADTTVNFKTVMDNILISISKQSKSGNQLDVCTNIPLNALAMLASQEEGVIQVESTAPAAVADIVALKNLTTVKEVICYFDIAATAVKLSNDENLVLNVMKGTGYSIKFFGIEADATTQSLYKFDRVDMAQGVNSKTVYVDSVEKILIPLDGAVTNIQLNSGQKVTNLTLDELKVIQMGVNDIVLVEKNGLFARGGYLYHAVLNVEQYETLEVFTNGTATSIYTADLVVNTQKVNIAVSQRMQQLNKEIKIAKTMEA